MLAIARRSAIIAYFIARTLFGPRGNPIAPNLGSKCSRPRSFTMAYRGINGMKYPLSEKALAAIRSNAASILDVEASDRSQRTTLACSVGNENENPSNRYQNTYNALVHSVKNTEERLSSIAEAQDLPSNQPCGVNYASLETREGANLRAPLNHAEVQDLNFEASGHVLRGDEKKAIALYKCALKLTTNEVARIEQCMNTAMNEPEYLQSTIYLLLSQEWTVVTFIIAEIKTMMAIIYERIGDYDKAIKSCKEAREVYGRQIRRDSANQEEDLLSAKDNYEIMTRMADKLDEAKETFEKRKRLHEDILQIYDEIKTAQRMGQDSGKMFDVIFEKTSLVLSLEIQSLGKNHPQVSETMSFMSKLFIERNDIVSALDSMERAAAISEVALGSKHPKTGERFYELALLYDSINGEKAHIINASLCYQKALDAYKEAGGDHSRIIGSISNDFGVLLIKQGYSDEAIQCLSDALAIYDSSNMNNGTCADTAQVWRNIAECYALRKEWDMAVINFESALRVQRDARRIFDTARERNAKLEMPLLVQDEQIADTLKRLGKAYTINQEYSKAYIVFLEGLTILQTACQRAKDDSGNFSTFDEAVKQDKVANIIYCIAEAKEADKQYNEAMLLFDEALGFRRYSDSLRPKGNKQNRIHIAMCLAGIGNMRMQRGEYIMAFKAFNEAIYSARAEDLPEYHPIVQMLWERSRVAAKIMEGEENSLIDRYRHVEEKEIESSATQASHHTDDTQDKSNEQDTENIPENIPKTMPEIMQDPPKFKQCSAWFQSTSRFEKKAAWRRKKGDIDGAIEAKQIVFEFQHAHFTKRLENGKSTTKESRLIAKTLVDIANLHLIKEESTVAEKLFKVALGHYKSSGLTKEAKCMQDIQGELDRLSCQNKQGGGG